MEDVLGKAHWFDAIHREVVRDTPRRQLLASAGGLLAGLLLGSTPAATAKPCNRRACARQWPGNDEAAKRNRASCEATCRRCKRTETKFCIAEGDPDDPAKVADCCPNGADCVDGTCRCSSGHLPCGRQCCASGEYCLDGECSACCPPGHKLCPDGACILEDLVCCKGYACVPGWECCDHPGDVGWCGAPTTNCGIVTDRTLTQPVCRCPTGEVPCGGRCCPFGHYCIEGECSHCPPDAYRCPGDGACWAEEVVCCDGYTCPKRTACCVGETGGKACCSD
jgi:hypothetical protein